MCSDIVGGNLNITMEPELKAVTLVMMLADDREGIPTYSSYRDMQRDLTNNTTLPTGRFTNMGSPRESHGKLAGNESYLTP